MSRYSVPKLPLQEGFHTGDTEMGLFHTITECIDFLGVMKTHNMKDQRGRVIEITTFMQLGTFKVKDFKDCPKFGIEFSDFNAIFH